jgi:hypothetical protein
MQVSRVGITDENSSFANLKANKKKTKFNDKIFLF